MNWIMDGWQICRFTSCTKSTHMCRVPPYSSQNIIDLKTDCLPSTSHDDAERNNGGTCIRWTPRSRMGSMKSLSVSPWYVGHTYLMWLHSQHGLCGFISLPIYQGHDSLFSSKRLFVGPWILLGAHLLWASARTINGNVPEMPLSCMPCQVF